MGKKIYTVVGSTGDVGRAVRQRLVAMGHHVRGVSRSEGVSLDDTLALRQSFEGADGAYVVVPFDHGAANLHAREAVMGHHLETAIRSSRVRRIVLISGLNAELKMGTSLGAALMEDRLRSIGIPELALLRAGWFMENFSKGLSFATQAATGTFATPFRADRKMPMVSSSDVGRRVAELLTRDPWNEDVIHELLGGGDYTMREATDVMASAACLGRVEYVEVSATDALAGMLASGMSPGFADAVIETARSFNSGEHWGKQHRTSANTTETTLEQWARQTFAPERRVA